MTTKTILMLTDEIGSEGEHLEAGSTYELPASSADHWLKREKAELVEDGTLVPKSKKVTPKAPFIPAADATSIDVAEQAGGDVGTGASTEKAAKSTAAAKK